MDEVLKARKLASAASRKVKAEERHLWTQKLEERRKVLWGYGSDEEELSGEESPMLSPVTDSHSNETTSIPEHGSPILSGTLNAPFLHDSYLFETPEDETTADPEESGVNHEEVDDAGHLMPSTPPSSALNLHASILVVDDPTTPSIFEEISGGEDGFSPPSTPGIWLDTPIETAKSVQYLIPMSRPCIVSVRHLISPTQTTSLDAVILSPSWPLPRLPPPRSAKRKPISRSFSADESTGKTNAKLIEPVLSPSMLEFNVPNMDVIPQNEGKQMGADTTSKKETASSPSIYEATAHAIKGSHRDESLVESAVGPEAILKKHALIMEKQKRQSVFIRPQTSHGVVTRSSVAMFSFVPPPMERASSDLSQEIRPLPSDQFLEENRAEQPKPGKLSRMKSLTRSKSRKEKLIRSATSSVDDLGVSTKVSSGTSSPVPSLTRKPSKASLVTSSPAPSLTRKPSKSRLMDNYPWPNASAKSHKHGALAEAFDSPPVPALTRKASKTSLMDNYPWPKPAKSSTSGEDTDLPSSSRVTGLGLRRSASRKLLRHIVFEHEMASVPKRQ